MKCIVFIKLALLFQKRKKQRKRSEIGPILKQFYSKRIPYSMIDRSHFPINP